MHCGRHCGRGCPPPTVGTFMDFGGLNPGFGWVIRLKLTSTLAPNVYCSIRGTVYLLSDVLDTKEEGMDPPPTVGTFFGDFGELKPGLGWVVRLKSTSTLAPNVYNNCSIRWTILLVK